ncbi:hypothetical protein Tco_1310463 [Tanacetum coccineum]
MHQNESLAIAERNIYEDEVSSSNNTRTKPSAPLKNLRELSLPNSSGFQNPIALPAEQIGRIIDLRDILLIQGTCKFQGLKSEDPLHHIKYYLSIVDNIQADGATRDTSRLRFFHFFIKAKAAEWLDKMPPTQIMTWDQLCLDPFPEPDPTRDRNKTRTRRRSDPQTQIDWGIPELTGDGNGEYPNCEIGDGAGRKISESPWGSRSPLGTRMGMENDSPIGMGMGMGMGMRLINGDGDGCHEAKECRQNNLADQVCLSGGDIYNDPSLLRSKIKGKLANFMLEKKFHMKGIGEMLDQHPPSQSTPANHAEGATEKEGPEGAESSSMDEEAPRSSIFHQPSKSSNLPFPSRVKKQKKDNEDERLLSIFK